MRILEWEANLLGSNPSMSWMTGTNPIFFAILAVFPANSSALPVWEPKKMASSGFPVMDDMNKTTLTLVHPKV